MIQQVFSVYIKELEMSVPTKPAKQMFIALLINAQTWEEPKCPLVGERIKNCGTVNMQRIYS